MGKPLNDLTGFSFGSLTVLQLGKSRGNGAIWLCQCNCGNQKEMRATDLVQGKVHSCGCEQSKRKAEAIITHGMTGTRTYRIWNNMKARCRTHLDYAGRGITVCDRWKKFDNFLEDMGVAPDGMSLDRIDVNGNYEKSNCRWATQAEQMNNTRASVFIEFDGKRQTVATWAKELGMNYQTLRGRIKRGWETSRVLAGAELQDADGNVMTQEQADEFIATLP